MNSQSARFIRHSTAAFVGSVILASSSFAGLGIIDVSRSPADCANARAKQPSALSAQQNDIASIGASIDGVSEKDLEHMVIEGSSALSDCLNDVRFQADEKGNDSPSFIREKLVQHLSMKYDSLPPKTQKLFQSKEKFVSLGLMARTLEGEVASLGKCAKNLDDTEGSSAPFPNIYAAARIMTNRADLVHRGSALSSANPSTSNAGEDPESVNDPYLNEARSAANVSWQEFASSAEAPQGNKSLDAILFHPK
jgi:hypothetical protein